ncbi:MAG: sulfate/thiosulfate transport system permease protein [Solirubrobacteraceae bacterium]|jgi:sulfate transport system permease protein|nr:sulfate/thiosulfate transport system permease protein [Solirubrobacteraceae bacterium]
MSAAAVIRRKPRAASHNSRRGALPLGISTMWLSLIVLLPLAALVGRSLDGGTGQFWDAVTSRQAMSALKFTVIVSLIVAAINSFFGLLIAWVLVRDEFPGKRVINALIDLPFALPTIVAGLTLLTLYGNKSPVGIHLAYTRASVALAFLFVTLPFVVRSVQPVLLELDREMEEASTSLGATPWITFRRIIFPNVVPALLSGAALAFARAVGEFGSVILLSGGIPFKTQVTSIYVSKQIESDNPIGASAVSVVLLVVSLLVLVAIRSIESWGNRRAR